MDVRNSSTSRLILILAALALLLPSCLVNPVSTPGSASTTGPGTQDALTADTMAGSDDSSASGDTKLGDATDGVSPTVELATVQATATDAAVDPAIGGGAHTAAVASGVLATGKLVVLLPDAARVPSQYLALATAIAQQGHRVLVLATPVSALAACAGDTTCLDLARQEMVDGQDRTPAVTVNLANSLTNRLVKALAALDKSRPGENWGTFYTGMTPLWSQIAIAGHGEGASQAAMVAMHQAVWRAVGLAGPVDGSGSNAAAWLAAGAATDATAWRAFSHTKDPASAIIAAAWLAMGLGSSDAAVSVDGSQQPGTTVQLLTTSATVADPHAAIAVDGALPADASAAQHLRNAWKILFLPY